MLGIKNYIAPRLARIARDFKSDTHHATCVAVHITYTGFKTEDEARDWAYNFMSKGSVILIDNSRKRKIMATYEPDPQYVVVK